ncbi:MAG: bifunctional adenosylcobinamide kinase/adenosylcobinamide-phosphate guanylyltransferase [Desulfobulbaceae bacterium]|nr:MAG: bifunctional adenosylcobinamide kinase/adenosylcobinamide-phosphate guanylyltransferase [Desulfobulbaceae bacterium]
MRELILGGVRSGKSSLAERLALDSGLAVTYIATARADDGEMRERIRHHQARRPASWDLVEVGPELAAALAVRAAVDRCLLVDCLTLWLTGLLGPATNATSAASPPTEQNLERQVRPARSVDSRPAREIKALLDLLPQLPGRIIMVSNESSLGIVPMGELTRRFCDESGRLHQRLAQICDRVVLTVAGLPHVLKETGGGMHSLDP